METLKIQPTNSTLELTSILAIFIYNDIKKYGSVMACFSAIDTNYDYTNVLKTNLEADRVISVINILGSDKEIKTILDVKKMINTFLDINIILKDVLNGINWNEFQKSLIATDDSI